MDPSWDIPRTAWFDNVILPSGILEDLDEVQPDESGLVDVFFSINSCFKRSLNRWYLGVIFYHPIGSKGTRKLH